MSEITGVLPTDEIEEVFRGYTKKDYLSEEEPYQIILGIEDEFTRQRIMNIAMEDAKRKGVSGVTFKKMLKAMTDRFKAVPVRQDPAGLTGLERFIGSQRPNFGKYTVTNSGISFTNMKGIPTLVCSHPIFPTRRYINIETGAEMLDISFRRDGKWRTKTLISKQILSQARTITALAEFGISVTSETAKDMVAYLQEVDDLNRDIIPRTETVNHLGWIRGRGFSPYIPDVVYDSGGKYANAYESVHSCGSFEAWKETADQIRRSDCTATRLILAASVASVILQWTCNQPFIVHMWSSESGTGKTIALMLAASVWADPSGGRYVKSLNSTKVAFEQMASFCNNLPLCLDELQTIQKGTDFDDVVYMLCEGTGKARATRDLGIRDQTHWLNTIITNGEQPITVDSRAGAVNRVISLETSGFVIPGGKHNLPAVAESLRENYGFAGEMIVKALNDDPDLAKEISSQYQKYVSALIETATGKQANYGATLLAADWLYEKVIAKDGNVLTVEKILPYLATPADVDTNRKVQEWLTDFVNIHDSSFWHENVSGEEIHGQIYGKKMKNGEIFIIQDVLKEKMKQNRRDFTAFMKWAKSKNLIRTWYTQSDRHWAITTQDPTSRSDDVGYFKAVCFLPKMFEKQEKSTLQGTLVDVETPW